MAGQEDKYKFDERRKVLHRTVLQQDKIVLANKDAGTFDVTNKQEYSEEGIKLLVGELKRQRQAIQDALSRVNATMEATEHLEDADELRVLREQLNKLRMIDQRYKAQEQRESLLNDLQLVNQQYQDIIKAVGSHIPDLQ